MAPRWGWMLTVATVGVGLLAAGGRRPGGANAKHQSPDASAALVTRGDDRRDTAERRQLPTGASRWRGLLRWAIHSNLVDDLTGLANRAGFQRHVDAAAGRAPGVPLAVFVVDLDQFSALNDSVGAAVGDRLLRRVAQRLRACVDEPGQLGRLSGHAFAVCIVAASDPSASAAYGRRLIEAVAAPMLLAGRPLTLSCSVGAAVSPLHGDVSRLVGHAVAAAAAARRVGGSTCLMYTPKMRSNPSEQLLLQNELRRALERGELRLYYQPKVQAATNCISGVEALVRWEHPTRGLLGPDLFIPVAERFGLIGALGAWVLEAICLQLQAWEVDGLRMRASVNVSVYQLRQDDLVQRLRNALSAHRVDPRLLTLEITESVAMDDAETTRVAFGDLSALGVGLSIDDFGTGYSSLSHLRKLPATQLKIDQSFVHDLEHSDDARAVVTAVVGLAGALGLEVVAEGVETEAQRRILVDIGCDELQGYLFSRPLTAQAFGAWASTGDGPAQLAFDPALYARSDAVTA